MILLHFLVLTNSFAQTEASKRKAEAVIKPLLETYPGLSIAVGIGDEVVWTEGFGYANVEKKEMVETYHQFRYYSLSKSITGLALSKLIELGNLDIEKSIRFYLKDLPQFYESVKVRHLINHTAGVRHYNKGEWMKISNENCETTTNALNTFINDPLASMPGEKHSYSSFGYVLLSELISVLGGQNFDDFVISQLLEPAGIKQIALDKSSSLNNEVTYYSKWNSKKQKGKEAALVNNTCKFGGGGLVGTAEDLVKLYLAVLNRKILSDEIVNQYFTGIPTDSGKTTNYAFGISDSQSKSGSRYHVHTGSALGANSVLLIFPESKVVIVILGNVNNDAMNEKIGEIAGLFRSAANNK